MRILWKDDLRNEYEKHVSERERMRVDDPRTFEIVSCCMASDGEPASFRPLYDPTDGNLLLLCRERGLAHTKLVIASGLDSPKDITGVAGIKVRDA